MSVISGVKYSALSLNFWGGEGGGNCALEKLCIIIIIIIIIITGWLIQYLMGTDQGMRERERQSG